MKLADTAARLAVVFYLMLWGGGVAAYVFFGGPPRGSTWTAPTFLALAGILALYFSSRELRRFLITSGVIGFLAEVLGVSVGFPFGRYRYTEALGVHWLNVPWVMFAAWIVLVAYVQSFSKRWWIAALWLTAVDFLVDPLAAGPLDFWRWEQGGSYCGIPWTNFAGWLLVSAVIFGFAPRQVIIAPALRRLGASVILFFTLIAFGLNMFAPAMVGCALFIIHAACWIEEKRRRLESTR